MDHGRRCPNSIKRVPPGALRANPDRSPAKTSRRLFVKSYGCQMNVYDARKMADVLAPEGYAETALLEEADLVILNTCHIRERATEKVFSELGKLRALKAARAAEGRADQDRCRGLRRPGRRGGDFPAPKGGGCRRRAAKLSSPAGAFAPRANPPARFSTRIFPPKASSITSPRQSPDDIRKRGVTAFVTVQEGCDKFCTFCVVPYTRGAEDVAAG